MSCCAQSISTGAIAKLDALHAAFSKDHVSVLDAVLAASHARRHKKDFARYVKSQRVPELVEAWKVCQHTLEDCLGSWRRLAQLAFFERLFSWWHILHLPIFIMMIITVVIHVWAVHSY